MPKKHVLTTDLYIYIERELSCVGGNALQVMQDM